MTDTEHPQFTSSSRQWAKLSPKAHDMRRAPTPAEDALWQRLRNRQVGGAKFRRQHAVEGYIVDFICVEHRLIVEVDGPVHDLPDQRAWDAERERVLNEKGYRVLRVENAAVLGAPATVVAEIKAALAKQGPPSGSSPFS